MATKTQEAELVSLWLDNKIDQEVRRDPVELGTEFIAAVRGGHVERMRGIEQSFVWWLRATFDEVDRERLMAGLVAAIDADPDPQGTREHLNDWAWGQL